MSFCVTCDIHINKNSTQSERLTDRKLHIFLVPNPKLIMINTKIYNIFLLKVYVQVLKRVLLKLNRNAYNIQTPCATEW